MDDFWNELNVLSMSNGLSRYMDSKRKCEAQLKSGDTKAAGHSKRKMNIGAVEACEGLLAMISDAVNKKGDPEFIDVQNALTMFSEYLEALEFDRIMAKGEKKRSASKPKTVRPNAR